jgi:hypothetical protein
MRIGDNQVACLPENLHLVIQLKIGEVNVKGGNDLGGHEPEKNNEGGAEVDRIPCSGLERIIWI